MHREPSGGDWESLTDALLRGVAHALSNRTGALTALRDLGVSDAESRELLGGEIERLTRLIDLLRLLPAETASTAEALDVAALARDAVAVLALHPQGREVRWTTPVIGTPQPARTERWVLLRCLLLLCAGALDDGIAQGARELQVTTAGDAEATTVAVTSADGEPTRWRDPGAGARMLAERAGAFVSRSARGLELRLPTLAALRRQEGAPGSGPR